MIEPTRTYVHDNALRFHRHKNAEGKNNLKPSVFNSLTKGASGSFFLPFFPDTIGDIIEGFLSYLDRIKISHVSRCWQIRLQMTCDEFVRGAKKNIALLAPLFSNNHLVTILRAKQFIPIRDEHKFYLP